MKDLTDGQLEALQQRAMEHVKNGTQPSEEDERLSMQHAAARWANEDECPQIVADGNDVEAVRNLTNSSPPCPRATPTTPRSTGSGTRTASSSGRRWAMAKETESQAEKDLEAYRAGRLNFPNLAQRWANRVWEAPQPDPDGFDHMTPGNGTWGEVDQMWADGRLTDEEYNALCDAAWEQAASHRPA